MSRASGFRFDPKEIPLQILSLLVAFGIWSYVRNTVDIVERQFSVRPIATGLPEGYAIADSEQTQIILLLRGRREIIQTLAPGTITASLDFSNIEITKADQYQVPVRLGNLPEGVTLVSMPHFISVRLESVHLITRPVEIVFSQKIPSGIRVLSTEINPDQVTIKGPSPDVAQIQSVRIEVRTSHLQSGKPIDLPVLVFDKKGNPIEGLIIEPATVRFVARVERLATSRVVAVRPDVRGDLAPGFVVSAIRVDPPTVTLTGDDAQLALIHSVTTAPLKITNLSRSIKFKDVLLNIPPSVQSDISKVIVAIEVRPLKIQKIVNVPIAFVAPEGWKVEGLPPEVSVTVEGLSTAIARLSPGSITASVTIQNPQKGKSRYKVEVTVAEPLRLVSFSPQDVELTLTPVDEDQADG